MLNEPENDLEDISMLRLGHTKYSTHQMITIEGRLARDYVQLVEECCAQILMAGDRLELHLKDIIGIDAEGRSLLSRLIRKGVQLRADGIYTKHILEELKKVAYAKETTC